MKKYVMTISLCLSSMFSSTALAAPCLGAVEKQKIRKIHATLAKDTDWAHAIGTYDNLVDCTKKNSRLAKGICGDNDLVIMAKVLLRAEVYQWANAIKRDIDSSMVTETQAMWQARYQSPTRKLSNLCYDLKEATMSTAGYGQLYHSLSGEKPEPSLNAAYYYYGNKHGFVIHSAYDNILYLGNQCNVLDSKGNKGYWLYNKATDELEIRLNERTKPIGKPDSDHRDAFSICVNLNKSF